MREPWIEWVSKVSGTVSLSYSSIMQRDSGRIWCVITWRSQAAVLCNCGSELIAPCVKSACAFRSLWCSVSSYASYLCDADVLSISEKIILEKCLNFALWFCWCMRFKGTDRTRMTHLLRTVVLICLLLSRSSSCLAALSWKAITYGLNCLSVNFRVIFDGRVFDSGATHTAFLF